MERSMIRFGIKQKKVIRNDYSVSGSHKWWDWGGKDCGRSKLWWE